MPANRAEDSVVEADLAVREVVAEAEGSAAGADGFWPAGF